MTGITNAKRVINKPKELKNRLNSQKKIIYLLYKLLYSLSEGYFVGTKFVHLLNQIPQAFPCFVGMMELYYILAPISHSIGGPIVC